MPAPAFKAAGVAAVSTTSPISPAWPTHVAGDIALLLVESNNWPKRLTDAAGFVELPCSPARIGGINDVSNTTHAALYWCRATSAAMPAPTIPFVNDHIRAVIITFDGCNANGEPFDVCEHAIGSGGTVFFPDLTTTDANTLIVHATTNTADSSSSQMSAWTNGALGSLAEHYDTATTSGTGSGFAFASGTKAAAGAIGETQATLAAGGAWCAFSVALTAIDNTPSPYPYVNEIGEWVASASADVTPVWPPHEAGDIGILIVEGGFVAGLPTMTLATAAGFAKITEGSNSADLPGGSARSTASLWWCRATDDTMPDPTVDFLDDHIRACIITIRGCRASGDPFDVWAKSDAPGVPEPDAIVPGDTTTVANTLVGLFVSSSSTNTLAVINPIEGITPGSNLVNLREIIDSAQFIGGGSGFHVSIAHKPTAGAYGDSTFPHYTSAGGTPNTFSVAFAPEPVSSYTPTVSGGLTLGGSATIEANVAFNMTGSGGLVIEGSAARLFGAVLAASGGLALGGVATILFTPAGGASFLPSVSGGMTLGGSAGQLFTPFSVTQYVPAVGGRKTGLPTTRRSEPVVREREETEEEKRERERRHREVMEELRQDMERQAMAAHVDQEAVVALLLLS